MKSMLMAIMAVAVAVTFSAPAFAGEEKKDEKKGGHVVVYGEEKKDEKKGGHVSTFGEEKKDTKGGKYTDTFGDKEDKEKKEKGK